MGHTSTSGSGPVVSGVSLEQNSQSTFYVYAGVLIGFLSDG